MDNPVLDVSVRLFVVLALVVCTRLVAWLLLRVTRTGSR